MNRRVLARVALALVVVPLAVNALTGPYLALSAPERTEVPAGTPASVRAGMVVEEQLVGIMLTGFSVLGIVVAWVHHRAPSLVTLAGLLGVGGVFAAITILFASAGGDLTTYYGVQTVVVAVGVALAAAFAGRGPAMGAPVTA